jgi:1-acyl-sn-glycerol-3-phosphate acyltransferase
MVYPIEKIILIPIYKLWIGKIEGKGNILKDKPFIIAINHTSYYDVMVLPSLIVPITNKKMSVLVNNHYWKNFITRAFLNYYDCIPLFVKKQKISKQKNKKSLEKAVDYLKDNRVLMIFPEGKRSGDGKLNKGYKGVAELALKSKTPVIPAGIIGSDEVLPKGKIFPRFKRCKVNIGKPMYFNKYYGKKPTKKILEEITREIMKEIGKLIGQKYNY